MCYFLFVIFLSHIFANLVPSHNLDCGSNITSLEEPSAIIQCRKDPILSHTSLYNLTFNSLYYTWHCVYVCVCVYMHACTLYPSTPFRKQASWGESPHLLFIAVSPGHKNISWCIAEAQMTKWLNEEKWENMLNEHEQRFDSMGNQRNAN